MDHEISCLLGWLRTFPLQCQATAPADLSDGLAMAEVLVQIEPATFTPTWFAGLLKSEKSPLERLDTLLNMLLHYYTHNLTEDCIAGNLPVPELSSQSDLSIGLDNISSFLKLILGVAVTCSNKVLFISKIQSLDENTQHALTACIVSFISTKDWSEKSAGTEEVKLSPSGDEVWAQKVHELDYQVALLKEERINLMTENEELFGKVKAAQTLSRKDSLKSRHLESELTHMKDEFERLKAEYDETRAAMAAIDQKLKSDPRNDSGVQKLSEDISALKADFSRLQTSLTSRETGRLAGETVSHRLESQQELINELKHELHYQARLSEEVSCVKDQVDVLREQFHQYSSYSGELGDIKTRINELETTREDMMGDILRQQQLHSFSVTSNESVDYLTITNVSQPNESMDTPAITNVSQANNQLDETLVFPTQVPLECSSGEPHLEVGREALVLVAQSGAASVQEDEREESELEELEEESSTQPTLTARTSEEKDSLDGEEESEAGRRFRNIEEWNFSSVQTVDEKSLDEDHQNGLIDKIFRRDKAPAQTDEVDKSSGCFSTWMLPFFVKVFD